MYKREFAVNDIIWATPLYEFIRQCNETGLEKKVLDCGAGAHGNRAPPLLLFYEHGYKTFGIEIAEETLIEANEYCRENGLSLNIFRGDMRRIPFASESFSFVYSFNAIMFMTKKDIAATMREMERALKPGGLCYVNFLSVDDPDKRLFCETAFARRLLNSERFSYHEDDEADVYFEDFEIARKEKRSIEKLYRGKKIKQVYVDYIAKKK
jgi:SAM-dependent methyltransferase